MSRRSTRAGIALAVFFLLPRSAAAQVQVGAEAARDRSTWHFDNPSSYDTSELVPHFFEQRYTLDNIWLTASVGYRALIDWRTSAGATPVREASATDYDTFFDPGGIVWIAGTDGNAKTHAFRFSQEIELGRLGPVSLSGGYRLRLDLADFLEGARTDTRNGVLVAQMTVTSREYTNAQTHDVFVRADAARALGTAWQLRVSGDAAPASINRLAIRLPDKYPGQTLVYRTTNLMTSADVALVRATGGWPLSISVSGVQSWNYHSDQWVRRSALMIGVAVGRRW